MLKIGGCGRNVHRIREVGKKSMIQSVGYFGGGGIIKKVGARERRVGEGDYSSSESELSSSPLESSCSTATGGQLHSAKCDDGDLLCMTGSWDPEPCLSNC